MWNNFSPFSQPCPHLTSCPVQSHPPLSGEEKDTARTAEVTPELTQSEHLALRGCPLSRDGPTQVSKTARPRMWPPSVDPEGGGGDPGQESRARCTELHL